jgi:hypothetical protein
VPVLPVIGDKDTTAFGKDMAPPAIRATLGNYPKLGKEAASRIPHVRLIEFSDLANLPQVQSPEVFHKVLLPFGHGSGLTDSDRFVSSASCRLLGQMSQNPDAGLPAKD